MNWLVLGVASIAGVALENVFSASLMLGRTKAPILLGVVAYYALCRNRGLMLFASIGGGLLRDAVSGLPLGCSALGLVMVGEILRMHRAALFDRRLLTRLALGLVAGTMFGMAVYMAVLLVSGLGMSVGVPEALGKAMGQGVWGMAALPLVIVVMEKFERMVGNVRVATNDPG